MESKNECPLCYKTYKEFVNLNIHLSKVHKWTQKSIEDSFPIPPLKTPIKIQFKKVKKARRDKGNCPSYICGIESCHKSFHNKYLYDFHMKAHQERKCFLCEKEFSDAVSVSYHLIRMHEFKKEDLIQVGRWKPNNKKMLDKLKMPVKVLSSKNEEENQKEFKGNSVSGFEEKEIPKYNLRTTSRKNSGLEEKSFLDEKEDETNKDEEEEKDYERRKRKSKDEEGILVYEPIEPETEEKHEKEEDDNQKDECLTESDFEFFSSSSHHHSSSSSSRKYNKDFEVFKTSSGKKNKGKYFSKVKKFCREENCGKYFTNKSLYEDHMRNHNLQKCHLCDNKTFKNVTIANLHYIRIHKLSIEDMKSLGRWRPENKHYMNEMNKVIQSISSKNSSLKKVEREEKCPLCQKDFTCKAVVNKHLIKAHAFEPNELFSESWEETGKSYESPNSENKDFLFYQERAFEEDEEEEQEEEYLHTIIEIKEEPIDV